MAVMTVKEQAVKYYPKLWSAERLVELVKRNVLTETDYKEITGLVYPNVK